MAIRKAEPHDLDALVELERTASTAALGHIFPPELPFPTDDVRARWALVLDDPDQTALLAEHDGRAFGYVAFGNGWLQHLGVVPDAWGTGLALELHQAAVDALAASGAETAYLWVLVENHRARAFYLREGWSDTTVEEKASFPPHPSKIQMTRPLHV